jgi:hypothetical protein
MSNIIALKPENCRRKFRWALRGQDLPAWIAVRVEFPNAREMHILYTSITACDDPKGFMDDIQRFVDFFKPEYTTGKNRKLELCCFAPSGETTERWDITWDRMVQRPTDELDYRSSDDALRLIILTGCETTFVRECKPTN